MLHEFIIQLQCLALCLYLSVRLSVESVVKVFCLSHETENSVPGGPVGVFVAR